MNTFVLVAAAILAVLLLGRTFLSTNPVVLARGLKQVFGLTLLIFSGFLLLSGRWLAAIPLVVFGIGMFMPNFLKSAARPATFGAPGVSGRRSTVRSAALEMELDHDSGVMSGRVLAGTFEGHELARLSIADLKRLWREVRGDPESRALLEAYMDRRDAFWREDLDGDSAPRQGRPPASGAMTEQEAYQILGLQPGAGETEIRDAHRRLMKAVHPDRGGSTFLAAKINEAKDRLIGKHRTRSNH